MSLLETDPTDPVRVVRDVIQRAYGDATQTPLDHQAASEIVTALRSMGWASLNEVALLIEAAGGSIKVSSRQMLHSSERVVERMDEYDGVRYTVRNPAAVGGAS
jgi:hypothetical protein